MKEFNGYFFEEKEHRKQMKFVVVQRGDLDVNNAYGFRTKKDLNKFLKETYRDIEAVFEVKDITKPF
jgi:hypothetical protein